MTFVTNAGMIEHHPIVLQPYRAREVIAMTTSRDSKTENGA